MTYAKTIKTLFNLLELAKKADTYLSEEWQRNEDASQNGFYGHIANALKSIEGEVMYKNWLETNQIPDWVENDRLS